ncbi:MAG: WS/DGAT/MGAT family O-acyltransferase [Acidimicrobiales bacterium]
MEPLPGIDAAFLAFENGPTRLHVAAVLVLDPPEGRRSLFSPSTRYAQIRRAVEQRLHLVPQLRQRAVRVPLGLHHPVWVDDPEFELDDHLRRVSLPGPGGSRELDDLVADVMGRPLELDRPLWEMVVAEGLAGGRQAVIAKMHHSILDGVSGASVLAAFLDLGPRGRPLQMPAEQWDPPPLPTQPALLKYAIGSLVHQPEVAVGAFQRGVDALVGVAEQNRRLHEEGSLPPPAPFSAPRTSINGHISSRRRFATTSMPLEDVELVRRTFGTTVNDVILAGVAGALRALLAKRGEEPDGSLVALVPVSTRHQDDHDALGNQVSGMLVSLATRLEDPVERLLTVSAGAGVAKAQQGLTGGRLVQDLAQVAAPAITSRAARWASGLRIFDRLPPPFNVTVSSVPGPGFSLWCAGSRVVALHPVGPVAEGVGLNVTAMTYHGQVYFGLLGCRRLVPDVADLAILLDDALAELTAAALDARGAVG